jgi:hypothetical protein
MLLLKVLVEAFHTSTTRQLRDCSIVAYLSQTLASQALELLTKHLSNPFPVTCYLSPNIYLLPPSFDDFKLTLYSLKNLVTTMPMKLSGQFIASPLMPLFLGSCLIFISHTHPAQAQLNSNHVLLSQQTVIDPLLPPPDTSVFPNNQQPLPQLEPEQIEQYEQNSLPYPSTQNQDQQNPTFQLTQPNQYSQNFERYFVYVNSDDYQTLQRVRRIEPGAYIRQYRGRSIIQSGVFSRRSNAEQRVRELEYYGIRGAGVVSFSGGEEVQNFNPPSSRNSTIRTNRYYVVIPGTTQDLPEISDKIIQRTGYSSLVRERQQPRGPHVAVGPFTERSEAQRWNKYMHELGFGDARVYYSK